MVGSAVMPKLKYAGLTISIAVKMNAKNMPSIR